MRACPQCFATYTVEVDFCGVDGARLVEVEQDLLLGQTIDRYRVTAVLGRGGMGSVYRATHLTLGRDFALKVLSGELAANRTLITRFHREALALSKIRHSNIVGIVDFITTTTGLNVLIMDYLSGETLAEVIERGPLDYRRASKIAKQIAAGLAEAHRLGIIHRDVKPGNVFLVKEGHDEVVKLLDFGVVALDDDQAAEKLTGHGRILGTPTYMSPEQVSQQPIGPGSDLYALGIILFEMLTGKPPYEGTGVTDTLLKHVTDAAPPLSNAGGLEELVARLLEKDPARRPASGLEVSEEIERLERRWARETPHSQDLPRLVSVGPRVPSKVGPPPAAPGRSWLWVIFGAVLAAAVFALATAIFDDEDATPAIAALEPPASGPDAAASIVPPPAGTSTTVAEVEEDDRPTKRKKTTSKATEGGRSDKDLERAAYARGLTLADLSELRATADLVNRYKKALRRGKSAEAARYAGDLIEAIRTLPLDPRILDRRLDRLLTNLRGSRAEIPANLLEDIEKDYLQLRAQVSSVRSDQAFKEFSRRIARLEKQLQKLRYGD
ncbi:MAG: serine/threonine protein kinase [Deltaproteobacteria bacterium]|jgi:serine/threonine protein kinase|nr:serine/threonine protein kinase [Deltaproteobacteria bacterium]